MLFDNEFQKFKDKYHIKLNEQQGKAVRAIEGANLLLAVPGSGKTTVLITRLGHMVINQKISPESILAISFNKDAVKEMKERFCSKFGRSLGEKINFRTVNSLSFEIYKDYCKTKREPERTLKNENYDLILKTLKKHNPEYIYDNEILELASEITNIKNMMLDKNQIDKDIYAKYKAYQTELEKDSLMDYDDQLVFGYEKIVKHETFAKYWQSKYKYICVDEAQDLSKIQHEIIKILAKGNNIFMVGDEDQSIYSFRGASPKALLNFKNEYTNASIMYMERNYRSTPQIVEKANIFISKNKNRYEKKMISQRKDGEEVHLEYVTTRETQFRWLIEIAKNTVDETAFLYRYNESAIIIVDLFLRNKIPFNLRKSKMSFFGNPVVKDLIYYLKLALNDKDIDSLNRIYHKGILNIPKDQKEYAIKNCNYRHISVYEALKEQTQYLKENHQKENVYNFCDTMRKVATLNSSDALSLIYKNGYNHYLSEKNLNKDKFDILQILAKQEPDIKNFLYRLRELEKIFNDGNEDKSNNAIILSTIHSSKGLEYENVYLIDVYDSIFPPYKPSSIGNSKDKNDAYQEERRLFYVGITRAKNRLNLFSIANKPSTFVNELFQKKERLTQYYNNDQLQPTIGMILMHKDYGVIKIVDTEKKGFDTIISIVDSNGELSSASWNTLWLKNKIAFL